MLYGRFTFERIHNTKEQIIFYERAEKHKSKERTSLSFKRALFQGNDQSGKNKIGKWLKHSFGLLSCVLLMRKTISALPEDHRCSKYADYLFEFKLCNISLKIPSRNVGLNPIKQQRTNTAEESFHVHFNAQFYTAHPKVFVFLDSFKST